ncbi:MAG: hypothetical protein QW505_05065 [Thermoplasmata archaeon]
MYGPCCPGKTNVRKIRVGNLDVGIAELDAIIKKGLGMSDMSDDELRKFLLDQVKIYNYVPRSAEAEYAEAIWREFINARDSKRGV